MRQYSDQARLKGGIPLQMRVGINTGELVVRSIRKDDLQRHGAGRSHSAGRSRKKAFTPVDVHARAVRTLERPRVGS